MSMWHCHDTMSGERFEVHGSSAAEIEAEVVQYIQDGIDHDTGPVQYDVTCTAIDGSEYTFDGIVAPKE